MARVTVEDCIDKIPNRFQLVMAAAQRARKIGSGAALTIDRDDDKNPVVALREIAEETIDQEDMKEELIKSHQRMIAYEEEDDSIDLMDGEQEWGTIAGQQQEAEGMYSDDIVDEEGSSSEGAEPSLQDLAGVPSE